MKRIILLLMVTFTMTCGFAQNRNETETMKKVREITDSLTAEQKDALFALAENVFLSGVDSIMNTGMFMKALDLMDSVQVNWKNVTGREPSPRMYRTKGLILMNLEEWAELVKTTEECLSVHKTGINDKESAILYSMQGTAYRNLKEYQKAIRSYEEGSFYYTRVGDSGSQGDMLCSMAKCYMDLGKYMMASSFYEKGFNKFLEYFDTTRSALLRNNFYINDPYKKTVLELFASHLYGMALFQQDYGSRLESKDYLLMSAHCGSMSAKSEYQRIYGNR